MTGGKSMTRLLMLSLENLGEVASVYKRVNEATSDADRGARMSILRVYIRRTIRTLEEAYDLATEAEERIGTDEDVVV